MAHSRVTARPKTARKRRVTFTLESPEAKRVHVTGSFCDWETNSYALKRGKDGIWRTAVSLAPGRHEYRFLVDGQWCDDPNCTERVPNPFGTQNCVLHVLHEAVQEVSAGIAGEVVP